MRFQLLLVCAALGVIPWSGLAQDFSVHARTAYELEMGTFETLEIQHDGEQFTLLPPRDWRTETDPSSGVIRFYAPKGKAILTMQFSATNAIETLGSAESVLHHAVPYFSDAKVLESFPAYSGDRAGKGLDFVFVLKGNAKRGRTAVVGLKRGCASLVLTCNKDDFKDYEQTFGSVLRSFQSAKKLTAQK